MCRWENGHPETFFSFQGIHCLVSPLFWPFPPPPGRASLGPLFSPSRLGLAVFPSPCPSALGPVGISQAKVVFWDPGAGCCGKGLLAPPERPPFPYSYRFFFFVFCGNRSFPPGDPPKGQGHPLLARFFLDFSSGPHILYRFFLTGTTFLPAVFFDCRSRQGFFKPQCLHRPGPPVSHDGQCRQSPLPGDLPFSSWVWGSVTDPSLHLGSLVELFESPPPVSGPLCPFFFFWSPFFLGSTALLFFLWDLSIFSGKYVHRTQSPPKPWTFFLSPFFCTNDSRGPFPTLQGTLGFPPPLPYLCGPGLSRTAGFWRKCFFPCSHPRGAFGRGTLFLLLAARRPFVPSPFFPFPQAGTSPEVFLPTSLFPFPTPNNGTFFFFFPFTRPPRPRGTLVAPDRPPFFRWAFSP